MPADRFDQAITCFTLWRALFATEPLHPSLLQARVGKAFSAGIEGQDRKGLDVLHETESKITERGVRDSEALYKIAQAYAVLGNQASGLRVLRYSVENGFFCYPYSISDPLLDNFRRPPEFMQLTTSARQRHEAFGRVFFSRATRE